MLWAVGALGFTFLALFASFYDRFPADERIAHAIQGIDVPVFGGFVDFVNWIGDPWQTVALTLAVAAVLVVVRAGWEAVLVLLTFVPRGVNGLVKDWVERPRPSPELVEVSHDASGYGFPSGHVMGSTVFFGLLFFLIPYVISSRPLRWALQGACVLAVLAAGPTRVYAGAHWPSDALAGYLLAFLFLVPAILMYRAFRGRGRTGTRTSEPRSG